jgi:hypothetical protein
MNNSSSKQEQNFFDDEISLKYIFGLFKPKLLKLYYYKKLIIIFIIIGLITGWRVYKKQITKYNAEITFILDEEKSSLGGGLASQLGLDLGGSSPSGIFSGENLFYFFKSRAIIEKTLLTKTLIENKYTTFADYFMSIYHPKDKYEIFFRKTENNKLSIQQIILLRSIRGEIINEILSLKQKDKKTSLISVEVISKNELFSKLFCEQIVNEVSMSYIETKSKKARLNRDLLQKQADSIRLELYKAIDGVAKSVDKIYNFNPSLGINKTPSTKRNIDIQTNSSILSQIIINLEASKAALRKETPLIQIIDYPILPLGETRNSLNYYLFLFGILFSIIPVIYILVFKK